VGFFQACWLGWFLGKCFVVKRVLTNLSGFPPFNAPANLSKTILVGKTPFNITHFGLKGMFPSK
jgi:hypothetical protein